MFNASVCASFGGGKVSMVLPVWSLVSFPWRGVLGSVLPPRTMLYGSFRLILFVLLLSIWQKWSCGGYCIGAFCASSSRDSVAGTAASG